jgi:hypothetical protein
MTNTYEEEQHDFSRNESYHNFDERKKNRKTSQSMMGLAIGWLSCVSFWILSSSCRGFAPPTTAIGRGGLTNFQETHVRSWSPKTLALLSPFPLEDATIIQMMNPMEVSTMTIAEGIRDVTIFQGKTLSLLHPVMMFGLLALSLSTALLGFQWRRQRTLGDEIRTLQTSLPPKTEKEQESIEEVDILQQQQAATIQSQIDALLAERKQLASEGPRDKHFNQGATLAFLGTLFAIEVRIQLS